MSSYQPQGVDPGMGLGGGGLAGDPSVGDAMKQVKAMLKQQLDQQHYAALMAGIQMNCMKACDNNARSTLGKKLLHLEQTKIGVFSSLKSLRVDFGNFR